MKKSNLLITVLVAVIASVVTGYFMPSGQGTTSSMAKEETTYERIMRTGKIRCGYATWPPFLYSDPNSGELKGASFDIMTGIADFLELDIEWTEEVSFGNYLEGLKAGRYDIMCVTEWPAPGRIKQQATSMPVFYSTVYAYVRADDNRFDGNIKLLNNEQVKLAMIEGSSDQPIVEEDFPKAARLALPESADHSQLILSLVTKKADAVFIDEGIANDYLKTNPGKIKKIKDVSAVRLFPETFSFKDEDGHLKGVLDSTIMHLQTSNYIKNILNNYETTSYSPKIILDQ